MAAPQYPPQATYAQPMMPMQPEKTAKPVVAGALLIVAALIAIIDWGMIIVGSSQLDAFLPGLSSIVTVCGAIGLIFGIFALIGGVFALQRKMWGLALVGSILGLLTIGFLFLSSLFSLIALILIAISKSEFT